MATVQHPEVERCPVGARFEKHVLMVAPQRMDVILPFAEQEDDVEYLLAARSAIDGVPEQKEGVVCAQGDDIFEQASEGQGTAVNIGNDESPRFHEILYSTRLLACKLRLW